jgi:hypothetical protein
MEGVQNAIDEFNELTDSNLRSAEELFKDWAIAVELDQEGSDRWDIKNIDFGDPDFTSWTIDIANDQFWKNRGQYNGRVPEGRWAHSPKVPAQSALPFGVSYETFRNLGRRVTLDFAGDPTEQVAPHSGDTHWWGGAKSQFESILNVDSAVSAGDVVDFWTWYFIEDGWDYGYVEALVNGTWQTVPLYLAGTTTEVTTDTNPHDNNTEGNGLTGTSGGTYFVDDPEYIHLQTGALPAGTTDVRFRYSTDAAYLDTGFFVDDVMIDGVEATLSSEAGNWIETEGIQDNDWVVQILSPCDLTPGRTSTGEIVEDGTYVYRFEGDTIHETGFDTSCLGTKEHFTVVVSNLTSGDIQVLDADYKLRVTGSNKKG